MNLPVYDTIEIEFNLETTKFKTHGRTFLPTARRSSENELWKSRSQWEERDEEEAEIDEMKGQVSSEWDGTRVERRHTSGSPRHCHSQFSRSLWSLRRSLLSDRNSNHLLGLRFCFSFLFFFFFNLNCTQTHRASASKGASGEPRTRKNRRLFVKVNTKLEKKSSRKMLTVKEDKYN